MIEISVMEKGTLRAQCLSVCWSECLHVSTHTFPQIANKCLFPKCPRSDCKFEAMRLRINKCRLSGALGFFTPDCWVRQKVNTAKFTMPPSVWAPLGFYMSMKGILLQSLICVHLVINYSPLCSGQFIFDISGPCLFLFVWCNPLWISLLTLSCVH